MQSLKQRKELIPIIAVVIALGIASFDLFSEQQDNAKLINSGIMIDPVSLSGRAACEVPIPDVSKRERPETPAPEIKEISN